MEMTKKYTVASFLQTFPEEIGGPTNKGIHTCQVAVAMQHKVLADILFKNSSQNIKAIKTTFLVQEFWHNRCGPVIMNAKKKELK